jgi:DtxR family manganese transport transcriptional regulator
MKRARTAETIIPMTPLPEVEEHARAFQQARDARRDELVDDYVELIDDLLRDTGEALQTVIAARLGVAQPTVARMLKRLEDEDLVERGGHRRLALTGKGQARAAASRERHMVVERFLIAIGVSEDTARCDAEGIEHHVSAETLAAFSAFLGRRNG